MVVKTLSTTHLTEKATPLITGEALFKMSNTTKNIASSELVKGKIVYMTPTNYKHGYIENNFGLLLGSFVRKHKLGQVMCGEVGIYTARNPDTVRAADVIFISYQRLAQVKSQSYLDVAPELIVEIISPSDLWSTINDKLEEYFNIGTEVVWLADPKKEIVHVYQSPIIVQQFNKDEQLSGGDVLPKFSVLVAELFV